MEAFAILSSSIIAGVLVEFFEMEIPQDIR
ncbi:MAG: hypothetical protein ACJAS3_000749 [Roseivirga sp.]|jgi:hypothetical protein